MERLRRQSTIFVPLFRWHNGRLTVRAAYSKGFVGDTWWHLHSTVTEGAGVGWGTRVSFFFFFFFIFFFFQKVASNPTEYGEDHFKLYPQVISPVSSNKKNNSYLSLILKEQSLLTAKAGWGEGEGEFLRSHGFRSEGDYRKLTAIRGGPW